MLEVGLAFLLDVSVLFLGLTIKKDRRKCGRASGGKGCYNSAYTDLRPVFKAKLLYRTPIRVTTQSPYTNWRVADNLESVDRASRGDDAHVPFQLDTPADGVLHTIQSSHLPHTTLGNSND